MSLSILLRVPALCNNKSPLLEEHQHYKAD